MSEGSTCDLAGILMRGERGLVLVMPGGGAWTLDPPLFCRTERMLGHRVHVVGTRSGFDLDRCPVNRNALVARIGVGDVQKARLPRPLRRRSTSDRQVVQIVESRLPAA